MYVKEVFGNALNLGLLISANGGGAVEFERIPPNMRGRVFGAITAGAWIAMPLGMLLGGIFTERFGTSPMLIGLGIIFFITTLSMAFIPAMKEMDRKASSPIKEH